MQVTQIKIITHMTWALAEFYLEKMYLIQVAFLCNDWLSSQAYEIQLFSHLLLVPLVSFSQ